MLPVQITFRGMDSSPALRQRIQERAEKLNEFHDRIMSCRVVVKAPHRHHRKGKLYAVSVDVKVPGHEVAVNREPAEDHAHEDIYVAIRDAFDAVQRRLQDVSRKKRGEVKTHEGEPRGEVAKIDAQGGFGFVRTSAGDEVYFHKNAVANDGFARLKVGTAVTLALTQGEKGLQATVVKPSGKHKLAP